MVHPFHELDFGRDIALRCPRPRNSGRNHCAAARGADGAARRYLFIISGVRSSSSAETFKTNFRPHQNPLIWTERLASSVPALFVTFVAFCDETEDNEGNEGRDGGNGVAISKEVLSVFAEF